MRMYNIGGVSCFDKGKSGMKKKPKLDILSQDLIQQHPEG